MMNAIRDRQRYIDTPFECRFLRLLHQAMQQKTWHVIVADPGSGKTMGIQNLVHTIASSTAHRSLTPILAATAPRSDSKEAALGNNLFNALGQLERGRWSERRHQLIGLLNALEVECLIVDDAHHLSPAQLLFLKELTDQGQL